TVPTAFCDLTNGKKDTPTVGLTSVTVTGDEIAQCKVLRQLKGSEIVAYPYSIHLETGSEKVQPPPIKAKGKKNTPVILVAPTITSSCRGCLDANSIQGTDSASSTSPSVGKGSKS